MQRTLSLLGILCLLTPNAINARRPHSLQVAESTTPEAFKASINALRERTFSTLAIQSHISPILFKEQYAQHLQPLQQHETIQEVVVEDNTEKTKELFAAWSKHPQVQSFSIQGPNPQVTLGKTQRTQRATPQSPWVAPHIVISPFGLHEHPERLEALQALTAPTVTIHATAVQWVDRPSLVRESRNPTTMWNQTFQHLPAGIKRLTIRIGHSTCAALQNSQGPIPALLSGHMQSVVLDGGNLDVYDRPIYRQLVNSWRQNNNVLVIEDPSAKTTTFTRSSGVRFGELQPPASSSSPPSGQKRAVPKQRRVHAQPSPIAVR